MPTLPEEPDLMQDLGTRHGATPASAARNASFSTSPHWAGVGIKSRNSPFRKSGSPCATLARSPSIVARTSKPVLDFPSRPMLAINLFFSRPSVSSARSHSPSLVETPSLEDPGGAPANSVGSRISFAAWDAHQIFEHTEYWPPCILDRIAKVSTPRHDMHRVPSECGKRPQGPRASIASFWLSPSMSHRAIFLGRRGVGVSGETLLVSDVSPPTDGSALAIGAIGASCSSVSLSAAGGCFVSSAERLRVPPEGSARAAFLVALRALFLRLADSFPITRRLLAQIEITKRGRN